MNRNKEYIVQEYYLSKDKIQSHPVSVNETLDKAYNSMLDVYKIVPEHFLIFSSIPKRFKYEFIKQTLNKFTDKSIMTIIVC